MIKKTDDALRCGNGGDGFVGGDEYAASIR